MRVTGRDTPAFLSLSTGISVRIRCLDSAPIDKHH
jgi:hypothetical protein